MSASLVKKGLKLFEDDLKLAATSGKKQGSGKALQQNKLKSKSAQKQKQTTLKDRKVKSALLKFAKKNPKEDKTAINLEILAKLSAAKPVNSTAVDLILKHQNKRYQKPQEKKTEGKSLFTEEDFQKFEQEYFVNVK